LRYRIDANAFVAVALTGTSGTVTIYLTGATTFRWGICGSTSTYVTAPTVDVGITCSTETGVPFEGKIWWPYLDFGVLGREKMLEGFDLVCTGEVAVSVGYSQRDDSLATTAYTVDGDTLPGPEVPLPDSGPSFQLRLTFSASQEWEFQAASLYLNDLGNAP
jgi:hypothetical protein